MFLKSANPQILGLNPQLQNRKFLRYVIPKIPNPQTSFINPQIS
jgi:hypothetical protein